VRLHAEQVPLFAEQARLFAEQARLFAGQVRLRAEHVRLLAERVQPPAEQRVSLADEPRFHLCLVKFHRGKSAKSTGPCRFCKSRYFRCFSTPAPAVHQGRGASLVKFHKPPRERRRRGAVAAAAPLAWV
jgi:hypothetical protein